MKKIGKTAKDIFSSTTIAPKEESTSGEKKLSRGRPPVHDEKWTKVTVVLFNRQIVFLDRLSADIRAASGSVVKRAEIIRALVDALDESGIDVSKVRSEQELKSILVNKLKG